MKRTFKSFKNLLPLDKGSPNRYAIFFIVIILLVALSVVFGAYTNSSSNDPVGNLACYNISFTRDSKYIIEKNTGDIYSRSQSSAKSIAKQNSIDLGQNESIIDASNNLLITSRGKLYYFESNPASDLVQFPAEISKMVPRKSEIVALSPVSEESVCQDSLDGECIDYYNSSLLYKDGKVIQLTFGVSDDKVTDFDVVGAASDTQEPAQVDIPHAQTPVSFLGPGDPYASKMQILTNKGVLVSHRNFDADKGYTRTTKQAFKFDQLLDIIDTTYEGRNQFIYAADGTKYRGSTQDLSFSQDGKLPSEVCSASSE